MIKINNQVVVSEFPIWELTVPDIPFGRDFFETNDLWEDNKLVGGKYTSFGEERKEYRKKDTPIPEFEKWYSDFQNENNILEQIGQLLDIKDNNTFFYTQYPVEDKNVLPSEYVKNKCSIFYRIIKDEPGYEMHYHFDNRAVFGNIFFNLTHNERVSTTFKNTFTNGNHSTLNKSNIHYRAPEQKNKGIFFMNTSDTYHGIHNDTNKTRYIVNILIYFPELTFIK